MNVNESLPLLGGMSPMQFMRRHWQKKPLLIRQAMPGLRPLLTRAGLFALAGRSDVESRLIEKAGRSWTMKAGPFSARSLPPTAQPGWTLLIQGVDLHHVGAHALLSKFRFIPDARLDDLMISWASEGGGVGPHFDSYDVFLLQATGRRRWRIGRQDDLSLKVGVPLKILRRFRPEEEFLLEAGDMLYLPPGYAHDGIAEVCPRRGSVQADCTTYSIGFRAPERGNIAAQLLGRMSEFDRDAGDPHLYRDVSQPATATPAELPLSLVKFARQAVIGTLKDPLAIACALGECLTEPKPFVYFTASERNLNRIALAKSGVELDGKTRMMYDSRHVFINGESYLAEGADALLMRWLANHRQLSGAKLRNAGHDAMTLLQEWHSAGWIHLAAD